MLYAAIQGDHSTAKLIQARRLQKNSVITDNFKLVSSVILVQKWD